MSKSGVALALMVGIAGAGSACDKEEAKPSAPTPSASASAAPAPSASAAPSAAPSASAAASPTDGGVDPDAAAHDEVVNNELQAHHQHHHGGFAGFVLAAVETLGIAPDQQTAVDGFRKEYRTKAKPLREANAAVMHLVADGIAAGNVDRAKIEPAIAKAATAATAAQAAAQELLNHLHGVLRPEQRAAFVDKVDAHWAAWREANEHAAEGGKPDRHLRRLAKDLSLTKDEVDKAHAAMDADKEAKKPFDAAASEAYIKAFDTAFAGDTFDAKKLPAAGPESSRLVSWGTGRMVSFYGALAPVLTPDQRTALAEKLRQRGNGPDSKDKPDSKEKP